MAEPNSDDIFAIRSEIDLRGPAGRTITMIETTGDGVVRPALHALAMQAADVWPGQWRIASLCAAPVCPAPAGGAPRSGRAYLDRVDLMRAQADEAGIDGAEWLREMPVGWLPVLETAVAGLAALKSRPDNRPAVLRIAQAKEKMGTLRFYLDATGSREFQARVFQIANWAELCSQNRCMLTGMPGRLREGEWLLTLSDEALRLRIADPDSFAARLYPV